MLEIDCSPPIHSTRAVRRYNGFAYVWIRTGQQDGGAARAKDRLQIEIVLPPSLCATDVHIS